MRTVRSRLAVLAVVLCVAIPGTSFAGTQKAPYYFGEAFSFCQGSAKCTRSESANARTGAMKFDEQVNSTLPGRGAVLGIAVIAGGFYLVKARRSVPVTVTFKIDSATAGTPTPISAAATGSFAAVYAFAGAFMDGCRGCVGLASKVIVSQGTPPALPALPPAIPGMPSVPPPVPSAPATPHVPGQVGPMTVTLKFNLTNSRGLVPTGLIVVGGVVEGIGLLGGGGTPAIPATPVTKGQPSWQPFLGPQPVINDVGTSRAAVKATLVSISYV